MNLNINQIVRQADSLRLKLLAIVGKDTSKQNEITETLNGFSREICRGDFTNLSNRLKKFLNGLNLLNYQNFPDYSESTIALKIIEIIQNKKTKLTDISKDLHSYFSKAPFGLEPEIVNFYLLFLTAIGKIVLKARGGEQIEINNMKEKFKSMTQFETVNYVQLHQNLSYDFAERLINSLGLNGAMIRLEKNRIEIFKQYKEKIYSLKKTEVDTSEIFGKIKRFSNNHLNIETMESAIINTKSIDWDILDINNHSQFSKIEHFNSKLKEIQDNIQKQKQIFDAVSFYLETLHNNIEYMKKAVDILNSNSGIAVETDKKILINYLNDVKNITFNTEKFINKAERNPISGKIESFKKKYIFDVYLPFHEKKIGKKANWNELDSLNKNITYKQIMMLTKLNCLSKTMFYRKIQEWENLKKYRCFSLSADELQITPVCPHCYLPKSDFNYSRVNKELNNIEEILLGFWEKFEKRAIEEIDNYKENLEIAEISKKDRIIIQEIITLKKFPETFDENLISSINKLLKEIDIVEIDKGDLVKKLFHYGDMISLEQFRKAFLELENELKQNRKEDEIRIKLK